MEQLQNALMYVGPPLKTEAALRVFLKARNEQKAELGYRLSDARSEQDIRSINRDFKKYGFLPYPAPIGGGSVSVAYEIATATVFAMTTGAKTILTAIAPAGHGLAMTEFGISFDGVTSSAVPALVDVVNSTQAGAGTSGVTPTITAGRGRTTGGSAPTGGSNYSAEPTTLVRLKPFYIPQLMGTFVYQFPLGREVECDSSAGTIKALGLRGNVTANVNCIGWLEVEAVG